MEQSQPISKRIFWFLMIALGLSLTLNYCQWKHGQETAFADAGKAERTEAAVLETRIDSANTAADTKSTANIKAAIQTKKTNNDEKYIPAPARDFKSAAIAITESDISE